MMKLDGIAAFVATAEAGSISAAARRLGNAKSVGSERLAELERSRGTRLIQRTTRKLSLTEDGHTLLARAQRILFEAGEAAAEMAARRGTLVGPLRISAPVGFGVLHLGPAIYTFLAEHDGLLYSNSDADWRFAGPEGWNVVRPRAALRVNNGLVMRDAALAGLGIALLPTFFVHAERKAGTLVPIDIGRAAEGAELHIAYPRDRSASAKVAALTDSLRRSFGDPPYWDR